MTHLKFDLKILGQGLEIGLSVGLCHTWGHGIIEIGHALPAVHLVLIGLNGDARQRGIAANIVRLAQAAVPGGKAALEQL